MRELGCNWELGFLRVFLCTIVFSLIIVKSLQLRGRRQIAEPRKYCLVRVIIFFGVCFLYLFCFSQVGNFDLNSLQVVSEPMVVCGEGGDVFMVPTQRDRESLNGPHTKILEKKERKRKSPTKEYC